MPHPYSDRDFEQGLLGLGLRIALVMAVVIALGFIFVIAVQRLDAPVDAMKRTCEERCQNHPVRGWYVREGRLMCQCNVQVEIRDGGEAR